MRSATGASAVCATAAAAGDSENTRAASSVLTITRSSDRRAEAVETMILQAGERSGPVERPSHGLAPPGIKPLALGRGHGRLPALRDGPVALERALVGPVADGEPGGVGRAERRRLRYARPHDGHAQEVRLELHQQLVRNHAAVDAQPADVDA